MPTRRRIGKLAARLVVMLVLATALTSCRSGAAMPGVGTIPIETSTPSVRLSQTPSPTAEPFTPSPSGAPSSEATSPSASAQEVVTIITLGVVDGLVQASGILPDVVESDGECTLTIFRDGVRRSEFVAASPGRESTYCGLVSVSVVGLEPGVWDAVLSYRSSTSAGESAPTKVQVP